MQARRLPRWLIDSERIQQFSLAKKFLYANELQEYSEVRYEDVKRERESKRERERESAKEREGESWSVAAEFWLLPNTPFRNNNM